MCKTKATVTLFVSLLNMHIRVSDVTLSVPCHRTRARVITIMLEILWRVTYGQNEYSQELNASYTFQPLMGF